MRVTMTSSFQDMEKAPRSLAAMSRHPSHDAMGILQRWSPGQSLPKVLFSLIDIPFTLVIVIKIMSDFLLHKTAFSVFDCETKIFMGLAFGATEFILLGLVSYDQYMAICKPLYYPLLMMWPLCRQMMLRTWLSSAINVLVHTVYTMRFPFYGPNEIHHFYCELSGVL
ncbi:Olfactory receptor 2A1/2A42 [Sciurus carolinensis]|uniref:Olfactory receptor 2A1/2A42 n=1 Tax=Sciurus carolinensis TaxID=30640 RepID=A0AA41MSC7_SCICA|nr:Olfactory receptor 2A1/2A42 [Sciurus carolinensis]